MENQERIHWYHSPIEKDVLRELTQKKDFVPLVHIVSQILLSVATGTLAYWVYLNDHWVLFILLAYIHCALYGFLGPSAAVHELTHRTVFKTRKLNDLFYGLCCFLSWTNGAMFRASHMQHHQLTVHKGRDLEIQLPKILHRRHFFQLFTVLWFNATDIVGLFPMLDTTIRNAFGRLKGQWQQRLFGEDEKKRKELFRWARLLLFGHGSLALLFIVFGMWPLLILVTFPVFIAGWFPGLLTIPQHIGLKGDVPDFRICCRTMLLNPVWRYLYWNMNYHIEHHMYAAVPYHNLPKLHKAIESDLPSSKEGMRNVWVYEILPVIRRQRVEPDYCIVADLPSN